MNPVIIIGMHRSGSSMLSKILQELGVFMGADLDQYAESMFFQQINEWLMLQTRCSWDNPSNIKYINNSYKKELADIVKFRISNYKSNSYLGKTKTINKDLFSIKTMWGWKDPRNTFTFDIWKQIFENPLIIHIHRNPVDVANSLFVRENLKVQKTTDKSIKSKLYSYKLPQKPLSNFSYKSMNLDGGFSLWEEYIKQVKQINEAIPNILHLEYEEVLKAPKKQIEIISNFLNVKMNPEMLQNCLALIDNNEIFKFIKEKELLEFYFKIRHSALVKDLNYDDVLPNTLK